MYVRLSDLTVTQCQAGKSDVLQYRDGEFSVNADPMPNATPLTGVLIIKSELR